MQFVFVTAKPTMFLGLQRLFDNTGKSRGRIEAPFALNVEEHDEQKCE